MAGCRGLWRTAGCASIPIQPNGSPDAEQVFRSPRTDWIVAAGRWARLTLRRRRPVHSRRFLLDVCPVPGEHVEHNDQVSVLRGRGGPDGGGTGGPPRRVVPRAELEAARLQGPSLPGLSDAFCVHCRSSRTEPDAIWMWRRARPPHSFATPRGGYAHDEAPPASRLRTVLKVESPWGSGLQPSLSRLSAPQHLGGAQTHVPACEHPTKIAVPAWRPLDDAPDGWCAALATEGRPARTSTAAPMRRAGTRTIQLDEVTQSLRTISRPPAPPHQHADSNRSSASVPPGLTTPGRLDAGRLAGHARGIQGSKV